MNHNRPKIITHYLPQFHSIPENDLWWGVGFTEWSNVRRAIPLFNGHVQPKKPLNDNYYDLTNPAVLREQVELARNFGIDGFCFYHYWFNGKLLLEKPVELFVQDDRNNISFCFSWANEKWTRAWDGKSNEVLIEQNYGCRLDWEKHFNYLLPFFQDKRNGNAENKTRTGSFWIRN
jgi:lipopolysaccharide biosynthesis protein